MKHRILKSVIASVAFGFVCSVATTSGADTAPAAKPSSPALRKAAAPDYAIGLASQQESFDTIVWQFRVENKGTAAPPKFLPLHSPKLIISVVSCQDAIGNKEQKPIAIPLPWLNPGESALLPTAAPKQLAGKGCEFKAQIVGLSSDTNPSNDVIMFGKKKGLSPASTTQTVMPSAGTTQPSLVVLAGPIQLEPSKVRKLSEPKPAPPAVKWHEVKTGCIAGSGGMWGRTPEYQAAYLPMMNDLKMCPNKNYSVVDQQAAGCEGDDTINQCMEKLFDYCMAKSRQKFQQAAPAEIAAVRNVAKHVEAYVNYTEYLLNTYGK